MTTTSAATFGGLLREWRGRRRLSQLELSLRAGVSARHLSFLENGRAQPSREMALQLAEHLGLPLRERNLFVAAAGYAPAFPRRPLEAPELGPVREAIDLVLHNHEPYPAVAVDRYWNIVSMNRGALLVADLVAPALLGPPANVYRLSFHPDGLARHVVNFAEYGLHLAERLRHDVEVSGDPELAALLDEVTSYGTVPAPGAHTVTNNVVLPMRIRQPEGELSLFSVIATFGTPVDVTVAELAIETFFPADDATAARLRRRAAS